MLFQYLARLYILKDPVSRYPKVERLQSVIRKVCNSLLCAMLGAYVCFRQNLSYTPLQFMIICICFVFTVSLCLPSLKSYSLKEYELSEDVCDMLDKAGMLPDDVDLTPSKFSGLELEDYAYTLVQSHIRELPECEHIRIHKPPFLIPLDRKQLHEIRSSKTLVDIVKLPYAGCVAYEYSYLESIITAILQDYFRNAGMIKFATAYILQYSDSILDYYKAINSLYDDYEHALLGSATADYQRAPYYIPPNFKFRPVGEMLDASDNLVH